ncbi:MAG TPA: hypothetical protein PLS29_01040 [Acidimicrobiales bacterium]|nr:MAG: hypothetical protein B7Z69_03780 [Actinobacteria bacterium 21-73-9]HQU25595.1 hypothetical protein [Acidimicrobiales bacterium]
MRRFFASRFGVVTRSAAIGVVLLLGVATPAGANTQLTSSPSRFCSTLLAFHPHAPQNARDWTKYRSFAKSVLATFEKLEATAPNQGTKDLMAQLVAQLKFYAGATSFGQFSGYTKANLRHWEYDWQQFAAADLKCVESMY